MHLPLPASDALIEIFGPWLFGDRGGSVQSVFNRLEKAVAALCAKLEFAYNEQLGYLTACPTNIGCGERASVHIKLPLLSAQYSDIEAIATKFNLQIRGVHGEHSDSKGGVFDVSNKHRLCITEWDGVKDLVQGTQALICSITSSATTTSSTSSTVSSIPVSLTLCACVHSAKLRV